MIGSWPAIKKVGGALRARKFGRGSYFPFRPLLSSVSNGRTTRRPSTGKAFNSMLRSDALALWGNAAPILVQSGSLLIIRDAVNPSVEASGETSLFRTPRKISKAIHL